MLARHLAVERNAGAWISEVRAHVMESRAAQESTAEQQESARARAARCMQHRRVASWPCGLDGLSSVAPRAYTLSERPWTEKGT